MAIVKPGSRLLARVPLRFVTRGDGSKGRRPIHAALSMTSMIDVLVVTIVFLLISFSASAEPCLSKRMNLPPATNTLEMVDAPTIAIADSLVFLDGALAGNTREIETEKRIRRLDDLFNALKAKKETWKMLHPGRAFVGAVVLQIDQDVPAVVVKSIFQTCAASGYSDVSFMVQAAR